MKIIDVNENTFKDIPVPALQGSTCQSCSYWQGAVEGDHAIAKQRAFVDGSLKGKVALDAGGVPMGYIQYGSIEKYPSFLKLRQSFEAEALNHIWVITCIMTHKDYRGRGVSLSLLKAVVDEAAARGQVIEAVGMEEANFEHISTGPASIYRKAGFTELDRFTDKHGTNILFRLTPQ